MADVLEDKRDGDGAVKIVYILYLAGLVTGGITTLIGVVMAYLNRGEAPEWLASHYTFLIRTFWMSILYSFIGLVLTMVLIGFLVLLAVLVWFIIRCIKGFQQLDKGEPVANVETWWV